MATDVYQQATDGFTDDLFDDDDQMKDTSTPIESSFPVEEGEGNDELHSILNEGGVEGGGFNWDELNARELEQGEKADDAEDFGDISDDDLLPDEGFAIGGPVQRSDELPSAVPDTAISEPTFDDDDDLFGPSSPTEQTTVQQAINGVARQSKSQQDENIDGDADLASDQDDDGQDLDEDADHEMTAEDLQQWRLQQMLFQDSGKGTAPSTLDENLDEWLKLEFPHFERDKTPFWTKLLPPRPARFPFKTPAKPPKPVRPSKVNLEIETDQKTVFASATIPLQNVEARRDLVKAELTKLVQKQEHDEDDSDGEEPLPGGIDASTLDFICTDFDTLSHKDDSDSAVADLSPNLSTTGDDLFAMDEFQDSERPIKKRRIGLDPEEIVTIHQIDMPSFDDPERMTARLSERVILDLNDPTLLVEEIDPELLRAKVKQDDKTVGAKTTKERLKARFKTSNDAEYDQLKENHKQKIRGQLGHMTIDHSLPAIRLQYPYYKVHLPLSELRSYHRKRMMFKQPITFNRLARIKKKERKNKAVKEIYASSRDLSLGDNSAALLLEYSEEHPLMLSGIGMGNRIVNYYRRKTQDDTTRPKGEIGETSVLLPEDKSPFHNFGPIDAGETVSALYNSMYRAPLFEHPSKSQDFLVVREHTGLEGYRHYLRNVDHTFIVGQELPSVTVPGTHSRAVTTASKNRLKAISFRIARKKKTGRIRVEDVTRHFPDTSDMQNRQKMKEFMAFNKEHKEWEMKAGEALPDEDAIQQLLKPEDICLLESMQVGHQYLQDAGYADNDDDDDNDNKDNSTDSIEQQLAPWRTTKNFIQATQGKAMLKLFGDGDPSGRGEAFSFIKTSMKGGFKAVGGSVQDTIAMQKELGGHSYNVARQQKSYEDSIRAIWDKQKASLSSTIEPSDIDDEGVDGQIDNYSRNRDVRSTPVSGTPVPSRRRDDETATSFSKRSIGSQAQRYLRIVRTIIKDGEEYEQEDIITDPAIIKRYTRIKEAQEMSTTRVQDLKPTGDADYDARQRKRIEEEIARLEKAKARRNQRDKTKAALNAASPDAGSPDGDAPTPGPGRQVQATQRKCANCGQVGHIKTNKKSVTSFPPKCHNCKLPFNVKLVSAFAEAPTFGF